MTVKKGIFLLIAIVAMALAPIAGLACDKHAEGAETAAGCSKTQALAHKAADGDEEAVKALIAIYKPTEDAPKSETAMATIDTDEPSLAQLAAWAEQGCEKSATALIAAAKDSGSSKTAELAARAESGCEHSKAALIAEYVETDEPASK